MYKCCNSTNGYILPLPHLVKVWGKLRINELEKEVSEWFDLWPAGHVDTAGTEGSSQAQVSTNQRESRECKGHLWPTSRQKKKNVLNCPQMSLLTAGKQVYFLTSVPFQCDATWIALSCYAEHTTKWFFPETVLATLISPCRQPALISTISRPSQMVD